MGYFIEREIFGKKCLVGFPMGESLIMNGHYLSCSIWPDRLSNCFVDDRAVNEIVYRHAKRKLMNSGRKGRH